MIAWFSTEKHLVRLGFSCLFIKRDPSESPFVSRVLAGPHNRISYNKIETAIGFVTQRSGQASVSNSYTNLSECARRLIAKPKKNKPLSLL